MLLGGGCESTKVEPAKARLNTQADSIKQQVAVRLAVLLQHKYVRDFIREEALKEFDGDFDILLAEAITKQVHDPVSGRFITFGQLLIGNEKASPNHRTAPLTANALAKELPLMQISIPALEQADAGNWDTETTVPLVAYIPSDTNEGIPAYDAVGNESILSATDEPAELVVVVGENERLVPLPSGTDEQGDHSVFACSAKIEADPYYRSGFYDYYFTNDYFEAINRCEINRLADDLPPQQTLATCDRDTRQKKDELNKMIFVSRNAFQKVSEWFDGGLDIEVTIFFANANGAVARVMKALHGKDHEFNNCSIFKCVPEWFEIEAEIITWDKSIYGTAMLYIWFEKDPGNTTTYTTSFSSSFNLNGVTTTAVNSVSVSTTDKDDPLGEAIVEYCDPADGDGTLYTTGGKAGAIRFYARERL